jgi:hypothetical protein
MAVDQSKSAGVPADDATSAPADSEHQRAPDGPEVSGSDPAPDLDEMKRKFRAALDRKRGAHASGNAEGAQDTGKVHGSHGPAASRRSFRRKSGS